MTDSNRRLRIWGVGTARTMRPHWMLAELGLDYETREIITRSESMNASDFRALSARGKIPLLEDGDLVIGESAAISIHLADRDARRHADRGTEQARPALIPPPGSDERAGHDELCFFIMTEMDAILYVIRRHAGLPEIYGESPVAVEAAETYFLRSTEEMVRHLSDGRPHLLGSDFSVADLLLKTCLDWAAFVKIEIPSALAPYSRAMAERPAFEIAMKKNFPPAALAALRS